ncbi:hypothetical protein [Sphaerisporangium aureirubrum]|uniref:Uncharacterized protein n=1 Tax=Sphaerisporangium aureirubrum TaxID=1544736 RepID=A0ABW1NEJ1_9ACTN
MMAIVPELYQLRPTVPMRAQVVRFHGDNAEEVAAWMRRVAAGNDEYYPQVRIQVEYLASGPRILVPAPLGWQIFTPSLVLHLGGGQFWSLADEKFTEDWEPVVEPAGPPMMEGDRVR